MLDKQAFLWSALIHGIVILLLIVKLPWSKPPMSFPRAIPVRLVSIGALTQSPALHRQGPPLPKTKMPTYKAAQAQPKPAPKVLPTPQKEVAKKTLLPLFTPIIQKSKEVVNTIKEKSKAMAKTLPAKTEKKLEPTVKKNQEKKHEAKKTSSKAGATDNIPSPAKAQDSFSSVLQSVQQFDREAPKDAPTSEDAMPADNIGDKLSISELDALRQQLQECWYVSHDMVQDSVEVKVALEIGPDARVQKVTVLNEKEGKAKKSFLAACTSVRQALKAPQCTPLKLPADKYHEWKHCTIIFSPKGTMA